jgi:spore coat polysaccharide biosynthesis predicted glycosyltransferase SpsG
VNTEVIAALSAAAASLIVFLFTRRAQLRGLNTTADSTIVTSAATLVASLETQINNLTVRLANNEAARTADQLDNIAKLNIAHGENTRIALIVARLETDLDIAKGQAEIVAGLQGDLLDAKRQLVELRERVVNGNG